MVDIPTTYGSVLLGALVAFGLSGIVGLQCVVYFKLYPRDPLRTKLLVSIVWFLDTMHSILICVSVIYYFITHFGDAQRIDHIPWSIAFTVVGTAIQTFIVHCFFAQKILRSSQNNWYITAPIIFLTMCRLLSACISTAEMVHLESYSKFVAAYPRWIFTTGLSLSSLTDILITGWLTYFLREFRSRTGSTVMIKVVDTLTRYTIETGALTCIATVASLICWLSMPKNLVFLGLHFVIGKLYANSLLASLNTRKELRQMRTKRTTGWQTSGGHATYPTTISRLTTTNEIDGGFLSDPSAVYRSPLRKSHGLVGASSLGNDVESRAEVSSNNKGLSQFSRRPMTTERRVSTIVYAIRTEDSS